MPFKIGTALLRANGNRAVLYPPSGRRWAQEVIERLAQGLRSARYNIPPLALTHEARPVDQINRVMGLFDEGQDYDADEIVPRLKDVADAPRWVPQVLTAIEMAVRCKGKRNWTHIELDDLIQRKSATHRAYAGERHSGIPVMSIHQAKNQQFRHVFILWPPGVPGSDELKARLLYNGITRAQESCQVFVRTRNLLNAPPFRFP